MVRGLGFVGRPSGVPPQPRKVKNDRQGRDELGCFNAGDPGHSNRIALMHAHEGWKRERLGPEWTVLEYQARELVPTCAACGSRSNVHLHRINPAAPVSIENTIPLCMSEGGLECHLSWGHGRDVKAVYPRVRELAAFVRANPGGFREALQLAEKGRKKT